MTRKEIFLCKNFETNNGDIMTISIGVEGFIVEIIKAIMSTALKDNTSLKFAVITGCLRISKESILTGTNHFVLDTISDTRLNECFEFIQRI